MTGLCLLEHPLDRPDGDGLDRRLGHVRAAREGVPALAAGPDPGAAPLDCDRVAALAAVERPRHLLHLVHALADEPAITRTEPAGAAGDLSFCLVFSLRTCHWIPASECSLYVSVFGLNI